MTHREILLFLAGAEAFHTLTHIIFAFSNMLPITVFSIVFTQQLNRLAIVINAAITILLLWWAYKV